MRMRLLKAFLLLGWVFIAQPIWAFYNPSTGRWLTRDPLGERESPSLYCFCANQAIHSFDRQGLDSYTFKITVMEGESECHLLCHCDPTEFLTPPDLKPVPVTPGHPVNVKDWIDFELSYAIWSDGGCRCVYNARPSSGAYAGKQITTSRSGRFGKVCGRCLPETYPEAPPGPTGPSQGTGAA